MEEGDHILIDIPQRKLDLLVDDETLAARRAQWKPRPPQNDSPFLRRYSRQVTSASTGGVYQK